MFGGGGQGSEIFSESQCTSVLWEVSIIKGSSFDVWAEGVTQRTSWLVRRTNSHFCRRNHACNLKSRDL